MHPGQNVCTLTLFFRGVVITNNAKLPTRARQKMLLM